MKLFTPAVVLAFVTGAFTYTGEYLLTYDTTYDDPQHSLSNVACSTGDHGLRTAGYTTFGSIPTFPSVGGAPQIVSWNSRYCGTCWRLTFTDADGTHTSLNFTALDTGDDDGGDKFTISLESMNALTNGRAKSLGNILVTAIRLRKSACDLHVEDDY